MKFSKSVLILEVFLLFTFCSEKNPTEGENIVEGSYFYASFDTSNTPIVTGTFTLEMIDSIQISGSWSFDKVGDPQNIGPQTGKGNLIGQIKGKEIWIELNPQYVDNNLSLTGAFVNDLIEGDWVWIGFPGPLNWGSFEAKKE
jgi:hypothetical protein